MLAACATGGSDDEPPAWNPAASAGGGTESGSDGSGETDASATTDDPTGVLPDGSSSSGAPADGTSEDTGQAQACDFVRIVGLGSEPLNVRDAPSLEAEIVGTLHEGQVVAALGTTTGDAVSDPVLGTTDAWIEIDGAGVQGLVTALYTECTEAPEPSAWAWPVPMTPSIVQDFGNPIQYQSCGFHTGLDIVGGIGDPIVAASDGVVVHVGPMWFSGDGQGRGPHAIILQHGDGPLYSTYGHNDATLVSVGEVVSAGELIAEMGTLGYSSGPHLHFEILDGTPFTGDWQVPFAGACDHYRDPKDYVQP